MGTNSKSNEYKAYNDGTDKLNQVINRVINKQAIFEANKPHLDSENNTNKKLKNMRSNKDGNVGKRRRR